MSWNSSEIESLVDCNQFSSTINRRIKALKKLQFEKLQIQRQFNREVFDLKVKYQAEYDPILKSRSDIISGKHEPIGEECHFTLDEDQEDGQLLDDFKDKLVLKDDTSVKPKGIPGFWLLAMKSSVALNEWIESHDEPVLMYLMDIKVHLNSNPSKLFMQFMFAKNPFFANEVLTKEYDIEFRRNPSQTWDFDDFLVVNFKGCPIDWKDGQNVRQLTKAVKSKKTTKETKFLDSFFEFFDPPVISSKYEDIDDDTYDRLQNDWNLGQELFETVVPDAVLHMTGELFDDDFDESDSTDSSASYSSRESSSASSSAERA